MKKLLVGMALVALLFSCEAGNLGFYLYPQAAATGVTEELPSGPLAGVEVVGYLPSYKIPTLEPSQVRHLTDLVFFSLSPLPNGTLNREPLSAQRIDFLKKAKQEFGTRVLIGIVDHRADGPLSVIVRRPSLRATFVANLTGLLVDQGFDGADFNWEYPAEGDRDGYGKLLSELKVAFGSRGLRLSVALSPGKPLSAAGYEAVDRIHGMVYDDNGRHATPENSEVHIQRMVAEGAPISKLMLGLPFYGRGYTAKGPGWSAALSYKTLRERYAPAPDQDTASGYYFNGLETVRRKVRFAKATGLPGVMVWEIGQDTTDQTSLLGAITEVRKDLAKLN